MVTLLSFILLTHLFTFTQEQVTSPVEVLEVEVFAREYKAINPRDPRMNQSPPPGPVTAQSIPGVRPSKESIEKPRIEDSYSGAASGRVEITGFSGQFANDFEVDPRIQSDIRVITN